VLHGVIVLLLGVVTCGLFSIVWVFVQANFIRKIDAKSNATVMLILYIVLSLVDNVLVLGAESQEPSLGFALLSLAMTLGAIVCFLVGVFAMRSSLEEYYNSTENIRLNLSVVMTIFFNILYFQHHLKRIADWKQTGRLAPQF